MHVQVLPVINEMGRTRLDVNVKVKSNVDEKLFALNLVVTIPMPDNTARADLQVSAGAALAAALRSCRPRPAAALSAAYGFCQASLNSRVYQDAGPAKVQHAEPCAAIPEVAMLPSLASQHGSPKLAPTAQLGVAGKAKYDAKKHALVWKIKRFPGAAEQSLVASVELIATTKEKKPWSRAPISLTFQVPTPPSPGRGGALRSARSAQQRAQPRHGCMRG